MSCINKNNSEFQTLVKRSGLPEFIVEAYSGKYLDEYGRFPYLDELPGANSENYVKDLLKVKKSGYSDLKHILNITNSETIEEANVKLNNEYRDLEIEFTSAGDIVYTSITQRPNIKENKNTEKTNLEKINSTVAFNKLFEKLNKLYGIQLIPITIDELQQDEWKNIVFNAESVNGFVYDGNIYINTDIAGFDTPIHELMHIMLGGIRYQEPNLYIQLIQYATQLPDIDELLQEQEGKSRNDALEEIFISLFARALVGKPTEFENLPKNTIQEIFYNMNRILDSMFMGDYSTKLIEFSELTSMSLKQIAKKVNSHTVENKCRFSLNDAEIHRIAANTKQNLMKNNELEEYCE